VSASQFVPLSSVAFINPSIGTLELELDELVDFLPMAAVDAKKTKTIPYESKTYAEVRKGYTSFADGDILLAKITPCFENGKISQVHVKSSVGFGSTEFHVMRPREGVLDGRYLVHFLRQERVRAEGERRMTGSGGQRRVPKSFLESLQIFLPTIVEQRRVASILDTADALREKRREALEHLDHLAHSVFLETFGEPSFNPNSWPVKKLGSICEVKGGKRLPKGEEYSATPTPYRYIRVTDFRGGEIDESNLLYLKPCVQKKIARYTVDYDDVVISIAGSIGQVARITESTAGANLTENAAKLCARIAGVYHPEYLVEYLKTQHSKNQIVAKTGQVTIGKLALFRIEEIDVVLPPIELQQRFSKQLESIRRQRKIYQMAKVSAYDLFESLQARAFNGNL
jgi:type I restriction enzyme, S subunit